MVRRRRVKPSFYITLVAAVLIAGIVFGIVSFWNYYKGENQTDPAEKKPSLFGAIVGSDKQTPTPAPDPTPTPTPTPTPFIPAPVEGTRPADHQYESEVFVDGKSVGQINRDPQMIFGKGDEYTQLEGVTTFRGNNFRDAPSYGTADVTEEKLEIIWSFGTGSIDRWSGSGWSGQPLMVRWPEDLKAIMNINDEKKAKKDLIEVIYPTMGGYIYFFDVTDGQRTRTKIDTGVVHKGTASIDPRGYPLLYAGQGIDTVAGKAVPVSFRIYSLIDQKKLYEFNGRNDPQSFRKWVAWDSSPLVNAPTDTLIYPSENGILYTLKLNSQFDKQAGTISINPDYMVKYRYKTPLTKPDGDKKRWWGFENSATAYKNYLYLTDNGGYLRCIDMNTMKTVWVQDVIDDSDSTMPFEFDEQNGRAYLYTACEYDKQVYFGSKGYGYIRKIDALNGEILWENKYDVNTTESVNGGILSSPVLGRNDIDNLVIYGVAKIKGKEGYGGKWVALDKNTGEEVWSLYTKNYMWPSPLPIYTASGKSYIVLCDQGGNMILVEGKTGKELHRVSLEANIEASPSAFGNYIVVGTRGQKVFGVKIK